MNDRASRIERLFGTDFDPPLQRINSDDILGCPDAKPKPATLTNREVMHTVVMTDDLAALVDDIATVRGMPALPFNKACVIAVGNKADLL